jgi:hypothetical protein
MMTDEGAREFVQAVAKLADRLIIIIDADRILSAEVLSQIADNLQVADSGHGVKWAEPSPQMPVMHIGGAHCLRI